MSAHPAIFKVVGRGFVGEDVDEEFSSWFQSSRDFSH